MKIQKTLLLSLSLTLLTLGVRTADASIYDDIVAPILDAKCVACHGEEKQKGKLRLDSFDFTMKGGSEAEDTNVVAGDPAKSYLVERAHLPLDDDEHMPPEDEEQLTANELKLIEWWIEKGAKKDLTVAAAKPSKELQGIIADFSKNKPKAKTEAVAAKKPTAAEQKAAEAKAKAVAAVVAKINATGATLMPVSAESDLELRFTALNVAKEYGDAQLAALKPIAENILWLDLAGTKVTDKGLAHVAGMKNLKRLYLQNTAVTDTGLNQVRGLANLEYLNLYGSKVSDAGIAKLAGLKKLGSLFVWQTKVTAKGAAALEKKIPGLNANVGWTDADNAAVVAKADPPKPAAKKTEPAKPAAKPVAKKPVAKKADAKPAAKPAAKTPPAEITLAKTVADAELALAKAKKDAADAEKAAAEARKSAAELQKQIEALKKAKK